MRRRRRTGRSRACRPCRSNGRTRGLRPVQGEHGHAHNGRDHMATERGRNALARTAMMAGGMLAWSSSRANARMCE